MVEVIKEILRNNKKTEKDFFIDSLIFWFNLHSTRPALDPLQKLIKGERLCKLWNSMFGLKEDKLRVCLSDIYDVLTEQKPQLDLILWASKSVMDDSRKFINSSFMMGEDVLIECEINQSLSEGSKYLKEWFDNYCSDWSKI